MRNLSRTLPLAALLGSTLLAVAQGAPKASLLVLSKRAQTLSIVDPSTLRVLAKVPVGNDPHEVIASTDGTRAYVSNYGFGAFHTLAVVDLVHRQALPPIDLGPLAGPHGLTFVDGKVWFTAETEKVIARYDPATAKVDWILGTGQNRTHMLFVAPGAEHIVTSNVNSGTISLIAREPVRMPPPPPGAGGPPPGPGGPPNGPGGPPNGPRPPQTDWSETVVPVGRGSEGFDLSPDGKEVWVANAGDGTVSIINTASKSVTETLQSNTPGANRLRFTPNGQSVLLSAAPGLVVLDAHTHKELKRLELGQGTGGILVDPDGTRAFVSCGGGNFVAVVDLRTLAVTGRIDAGPEPDGLAWAVRP